jgi:hypothetical protein
MEQALDLMRRKGDVSSERLARARLATMA